MSVSRLPDHLIDEVRARVDIVDVVSQYTRLERSGRRFRGLCPFHTEKTPSFYVDRETQLYYCFGCQKGGNVFNFLVEMEKAPFYEVVERLAERTGVPIDKSPPSPQEARRRKERELCFQVNELACEFFERMLYSKEGVGARRYLKGRGLTGQTARQFRLGYAPAGWGTLREYLKGQGIDEEVAIKAGVLARGRHGVYDVFRNRIIFPIVDPRARVIGFGGRLLSGDGPKYLNSAESPVFTKGRHLYGLGFGIDAFRSSQKVLLVEGYMDVVGLYQHGYAPSLASLGTAFTPEQARLIKRYASEVILAYDADQAGRKATLRGLDVLAEEGLSVRVARLPEGEDPDSFIAKEGKQSFVRLVEAAIPLIEYQLEDALQGLHLGSVEGRIEAVQRLLPILSRIESVVAREEYVAWAARRVGVSAEAIAEELERFARGQRSGAVQNKSLRSVSRSRHNLSRSRYTNTEFVTGGSLPHEEVQGDGRRDDDRPLRTMEAVLLAIVLQHPQRREQLRQSLGESPFVDDRYNRAFAWLLEQGDQAVGSDGEGALPSDAQLAQVVQDALMAGDAHHGLFDAYLKRAIQIRVRRHLKSLEAKLSSLMKGDSISVTEVSRLLLAYKRARDRFRLSVTMNDAG